MNKKITLAVFVIALLLLCTIIFFGKGQPVSHIQLPVNIDEDRDVVYMNATRDDIIVSSLHVRSVVSSPLIITGKARGSWYFEASFPVVLLDGNGKQIATGYGQADGEWMTSNFVTFVSTLTFSKPETREGVLILKNDNPSGDPIQDKELRISVVFGD